MCRGKELQPFPSLLSANLPTILYLPYLPYLPLIFPFRSSIYSSFPLNLSLPTFPVLTVPLPYLSSSLPTSFPTYPLPFSFNFLPPSFRLLFSLFFSFSFPFSFLFPPLGSLILYTPVNKLSTKPELQQLFFCFNFKALKHRSHFEKKFDTRVSLPCTHIPLKDKISPPPPH